MSAPSPTAPFRIGHGYDIHKLRSGGKLLLGGVVVSEELSPIAHSDGDVVIHALVDALLGAMGWGDIGQLFPDSDSQWKGAASRIFLQKVCDRIRDARSRPANVDITVQAQMPKIAPFRSQIVESLRGILGATCIVNIKAGTNEGCDAVGRGEAIAAHAVVLLTNDS
ncbi:MAG TPA: 2-C-methyl-D-erythritol 2,4-cyclodiphosphate synthase [Tepidisphaeraceae bacterium]|jgi:2-C-methyl-D-erythritol 2,4-cyclodiphosphate synthase